jgi:hypothetical protein
MLPCQRHNPASCKTGHTQNHYSLLGFVRHYGDRRHKILERGWANAMPGPARKRCTQTSKRAKKKKPKTLMSRRQPKPAASFAARSMRWTSSAGRPEPKGSQNAQKSYERYLALARAEAQSGNMIRAENYYQHAEHYFRSMSADRGTT